MTETSREIRGNETLMLLLVDDDEVDRRAVRRALERAGVAATIDEATTAEEALAALGERSYDCTFLDYYLPGGDGIEVIRAARRAGLESPVVVLTGRGDEELAVELMKAGATDYLSKGTLSPERLHQALTYACRMHHAELQAREAERALRVWADNLRALSEATLAITSSLSIGAMLQMTAEQARTIIGCRWAWATLDGVGERETVVAVSHGSGDPPPVEAGAELRRLVRTKKSSVRVARSDEAAAVEEASRAAASSRLDSTAEVPPGGWLATPLLDKDGAPIGLVEAAGKGSGALTEEDETILVQLARLVSVAVENARLYQAAQAATRARESVLAVVSHDLRNPLNAISTSAAVLEATMPSEGAGSRSLAIIRRSTRQMTRLVDDLLDVSRIERGQLDLESKPIATGPLLDELCSLFDLHESEVEPSGAREAAARRATVECIVEPGTPPAMGDRWRLLQALSNLLSNALRYTPEDGRVTVRAGRAEAEGNRRPMLRFSVVDTGTGIAPDSLPHLFEPFWQAQNRPKGGAGLGLAIVRGIVEAHGGTIEVQSTPGEGTTFSFTIPAAG